MKKTILATAILLAGAANAAEVYNNEGTTVSLGGSFRGHVVIADSDNVKFEDAGSRFDIKASKELDDGVKAFGQVEIKYTGDVTTKNSKGEDGKTDGLYINNAFVGLSHDVYGTVVLGKQMGLNDDAFVYDFSYEHGNIYNEDNALFGSDSEDQLKYTKAFGGASVVVSLMDQDTYAIGGTYEVAGLSLVASYNIANDRVDANTNAKTDNSTYAVGVSYALDSLTLGAVYTASEVGNADNSAYGLGANYALGQASVYAMFDATSSDTKADERTELVIGADYEIVKDVKAYAEFGSTDPKSGSADEALYLGARVYF
ncbi:Outer membrane protein [Moritella viscosa]|uniref:porin n=1 Tax=Moritella viscosa TaxID=80854 RepID=UPI0005090B93|nr:porin [Moritella viscosa]CED59361.1 outer membrane protein [Moritella viscosa]SHO01223.1 Outer membrane protein [Moritella viscosa]SHO20451.1 Outer membrane protein [Moritella viscosa]